MDFFLGTISAFGFNFAPYGWMQCNGQLLPISQFSALFALLGTAYGGNGVSTFGLPNLAGHVANGQGQLAGGNYYTMGMTGGASTATLHISNLPIHAHQVNLALNCNNTVGSTTSPSGAVPAEASVAIYNSANSNVALATPTVTLANAGSPSPTPINITDPCLVMNYCIAYQGIFPSRN